MQIICNLAFGQKPEDYLDKGTFKKNKAVSSGSIRVDTKFETAIPNITLNWQKPNDYYNYGNKTTPLEIVSESNGFVLQCNPLPIVKANEVESFNLYVDGNKLNGRKTIGTVSLKKNSFDEIIDLQEGTHGYKVSLILKGKAEIFSGEIFINYTKTVSNLFLFTIGVPHYNLHYTQKDASDFGKVFKQNVGKIFKSTFVKQFTSTDSTDVLSLRSTFENISKNKFKISKNDVIIIYISTHGVTHREKYILPCYNFIEDNEETYSLDYERDILAKLSYIDCKKIIFLDACKSGRETLIASRGDEFQDIQKAIVSSENKVYLFASSTGTQSSYENDIWQNGVFTEAIIEGLVSGKADTKSINKIYKKNSLEVEDVIIKEGADGTIWLSELKSYLEIRVPQLINNVKEFREANIRQNPTIADIDLKNDYPLYYVDEKK